MLATTPTAQSIASCSGMRATVSAASASLSMRRAPFGQAARRLARET